MRHGTRRSKAPKTRAEVIEEMRHRIAGNLRIDPERIRYHNATEPGQFRETGWRWEIFYRKQWRELPWHFDGPLRVDRDLVCRQYGMPRPR